MTTPDTVRTISGPTAPPNPAPNPLPLDLAAILAAAAGYAQIALEAGAHPTWGSITGKPTTIAGYGITNAYTKTEVDSAVGARIPSTEKGAANGVAPLGSDSKIAATYLPSYVDDAIEAANFAALPGTGETGKIYVTIDTNKTYRWSGSAYVEISASPGSTDAVTEGASNLYFTAARVLATVLSGLSTATNAAVTAADTVLVGIGKLQAQINAALSSIAGKAANGANSDITSIAGLTTALSIGQGGTGATTASTARTALGLGSAAVLDVGTTANKVVQLDGSARLPAVDGSALTGISGGSGAVIYSGAQTLSAGEKTQARSNIGAAASGANSDVTSLSGLTTALSIAQGGTEATTAAGARTALGLGNLDNTSDANKPVSTAQQTALDAKVPTTRTITAGTGLLGGGTLAADRTVSIDASYTDGRYGRLGSSNDWTGTTTDFQGVAVKFSGSGTSASAANCYLDSTMRLYKSTSSIRYKCKVTPFGLGEARRLLGLVAVSYSSTAAADDADARFIGLIAEEVAAIDPRLVTWTERKGELVPDGVQYDRVFVALLPVIQDQDARLAALEARAGGL